MNSRFREGIFEFPHSFCENVGDLPLIRGTFESLPRFYGKTPGILKDWGFLKFDN